ncbi:SRPBCC family protein [Leptothoe kymatousa]|uniref:SRPBCC family protein n=1 Tax=Leptothoe kymatousa TAU-MAC 1615 TaxID=2364775 RepID=A0ABS5Y229_9CYAN|nr:SRPBCC family protein [Leptothoe kymatousa]MBT9311884.1 SRPBCC family protein [Leptothoe kymatousa TAU-MAC 1615]
MANWLEHSVYVDVEAPIDLVWALWSDLEQMPQWMKWIDSVELLADQPGMSRWKLASGIWEFTWLSRTVKVVPNQILQWESVDGLPNRGAIRFYGHQQGTSTVKMTLAYAVPAVLARFMENGWLRRIVDSTLQADLERFRQKAEQVAKAD